MAQALSLTEQPRSAPATGASGIRRTGTGSGKMRKQFAISRAAAVALATSILAAPKRPDLASKCYAICSMRVLHPAEDARVADAQGT